jgi:WD40 repeat protein
MCNLHQPDGPRQWDALIATLNHEMNCRASRVTFSSSNNHLASWAGQEMKLWDATSGTPIKTFRGTEIALAGDFSVVALSQSGTLTLYDVASNVRVANFAPSNKVSRLAISFDGVRLAAGLEDGTVSLWDKGTSQSIASFPGYARKGGQLDFAPSGYNLAFLSAYGVIQLWNGFNGEPIANLYHGSGEHVKFVFSRSGSRLAATTKKGDVYGLTLWNGENGELIIQHLAISDDGSLIATGKVQL